MGTTSLCCAETLKRLGRRRNQVRPTTQPADLAGREFFEVTPRRVLHVLRPEPKSERFYEPPAADRPESINDNFFARWARRPHPSGDCRCSFRNSSRRSTRGEAAISRELQRIRASLCEAEERGRGLEEVEEGLAVDLSQLGEAEVVPGLEPTDEEARQRVVRGLNRYISDLLDEILDDTIRAIAEAPEDPFGRRATTFDIKFSFHSNEDGDEAGKSGAGVGEEKGYVNQGFVGTVGDPDTLDFHLRRDRALERVDCTDSGINSVETVELQAEQEQNLEQSLMDIIDAKLGGSSIGKSLENLGMEMDSTGDCAEATKNEDSTVAESSQESKFGVGPAVEEKTTAKEESKQEAIEKTPEITPHRPQSITSSERASKSLDDVIEEPIFNSLRLEFKPSSSSPKNPIPKVRRRVTSRFHKTLTMIHRRLLRRFNANRRKRDTTTTTATNNNNNNSINNNNNNNNNDSLNKSHKSSPSSSFKHPSSARTQLRPDDLHRRRFPVPPPRRPDSTDGEVTLRRRNRKPTIVFLHGFGSSADAFASQLSYFAELGYPCLAPDMLGHGFSSAPRRASDYHFDKLLGDLEALLLHHAFKPGKKCVIVAHNYGCSFATALSQKYASNVHQLVLIAGGGPIPLAPPPPREGPGHCCLRFFLTPFLVCGMSRGFMYSARGRQHPYCGPEEAPWASTHMRHVLRGMSWPEGDHVFLRRICTPTLLVHGLRDSKVSLVQECQMERTIGKAVLEAIPTAGHVPMIDCPDQLNHMIHCFIDLWKNKKW
ncbi:uncharacterized protein LOC106641531 [Copidosoma floridanum]|uniref:uncharacterized protein LOC106641531 n=1 Tax=Copidosoma floridanum TaxID=29053 RepID=UPI0006C9BEB0|nr:uncharacterized protein LOC106641531 [Copidosoma floridanum]